MDLDRQGAASYLLRIRPKLRGGGSELVRGRSDPAELLKGSDHERLDLLPAEFSYRNLDSRSTPRSARRGACSGCSRRSPTSTTTSVVLDCPPAISLASENVFRAADVLLVPLIPTPLALRTLARPQRFVGDEVAKPRPRIIAFFSMADARKALHREVMGELAARGDGAVLEAAIPAAGDVEKMARDRLPLAGFAPRGRAARAYGALWEQLRQRL